MITRLRHWWKRNFGHVYLTEDTNAGGWYRFRARRGKVAFVWHIIDGTEIPFICRLAQNGEVVNAHDHVMSGYGQQYGKWVWAYLDGIDNSDIKKGGYW